MKTTNNSRLDLRKQPKFVRQILKEKKNEITNVLNNDVKSLLSKDSITKQDFKDLIKQHSSNVLLQDSIDSNKIEFKEDNTPDLRTLPKAVREILKSFEKEAEQKMANDITNALSNIQSLSLGDLNSILEKSKVNSFQKKWVADQSKELTSTKEEDFYSQF